MMRPAARKPRPLAPTRPRGDRRGGAVTLELILALPIWLIFLLAVIEFGQILSGQQQIALASRVGAEEASEMPGLDVAAAVPPDVLTVIEQQLASSEISRCKVILEHNVGDPAPPTPVELSDGDCVCEPPSTDFPPRRQFVRVTVCVRLTEIAPNLLAVFGFDITDYMVQHSTTFRYEL